MSSAVDETTCPTCGDDDFDTKRARNIHHSRAHGESLAVEETTCEECGDRFEYYPSAKLGIYCSDCVGGDKHRSEAPGNSQNRSLPDNPQTEKALPVDESQSLDLPPHRKGDATEKIVVGELAKRGIPVLDTVTDNERYDIAIEHPSAGLLRIQVKTGNYSDGCIEVRGETVHTNSAGNVHKQYNDEFDHFLVYCYETDTMHLLPEDEVGSTAHLRVDPTRIDSSKTTWASDYLFDDVWGSL